jgi:hypothetical protein
MVGHWGRGVIGSRVVGQWGSGAVGQWGSATMGEWDTGFRFIIFSDAKLIKKLNIRNVYYIKYNVYTLYIFTYIKHVLYVNLRNLLFYVVGGGKWCSLLCC